MTLSGNWPKKRNGGNISAKHKNAAKSVKFQFNLCLNRVYIKTIEISINQLKQSNAFDFVILKHMQYISQSRAKENSF